MNDVERRGSPLDSRRDVLEAIVALAEACGASRIARDGRHVGAQLDSARLFVSIVGAAPLLSPMVERVTRSHLRPDSSLAQRGVVYDFSTSGVRSAIRADLVLVDVAHAARATSKYGGLRTVLVDMSRPDEVERAFALIEETAIATGAARVAVLAAKHRRNLCMRLRSHVSEQQCALNRSAQDASTHLNALSIARVVTEAVLQTRAHQPDLTRDAFAAWLAIERSKFLMAHKVDAVIAYDRELQRREEQTRRPAHVGGGARDIVGELLATFWERARIASVARVALHAKGLLAELELSIGDLGETLSLDAMAGVELGPIRGFHRVAEALHGPPGEQLTQRSDRVERAHVIAMLESGTERVVMRALDEYDEARSLVEQRYCDLIDDALESARSAAALASQAQAQGADAVARAGSRVAQWYAALADIVERID